jgi:hypothetical protein
VLILILIFGRFWCLIRIDFQGLEMPVAPALGVVGNRNFAVGVV